jgi:hypothetical protein
MVLYILGLHGLWVIMVIRVSNYRVNGLGLVVTGHGG